MNLQKVISGFFFILAMTINFGFFYGDIDNPELHSVYELFVAFVISLISTVLKIGDKTQLGADYLLQGLVADIQLLAAELFGLLQRILSIVDVEAFAAIISLSGGALALQKINLRWIGC